MRTHALLLSVLFLAAASLACTHYAVAQETFKPNLIINIPTISFSDVKVQPSSAEQGISGYMDVPWIAQYMKGLYAYAVGIAGTLAGVMFVIGGFEYMTSGGDVTRIQKGKQHIADALIGLLLVLGAFAVLNTVSPELTSFDALRLKRIKSNPLQMIDASVTTTHVATGSEASLTQTGTVGTPPAPSGGTGGTGAGSPPSGPPPATLPPPSGNHYVQLYSNCPVQNLPPKHVTRCSGGWPPTKVCGDEGVSSARGTMFRDAMRAMYQPTDDLRRKIVMTAEAGVNCLTHYGSCGATATTWQAIAGCGNDTLGANEPSRCGTTLWDGVRHELSVAMSWQTFAIACDAVCGGSQFRDVCGARCLPAFRADGTPIPNQYKVVDGCFRGAAARAEARRILSGPGGPAGWPDSWTSRLEPGDFVIIFNGNSSCASSHAQIFLGWASPGRARLANGQWSGPQWESTECMMRSCGPDFEVVTKIFKPKSLAH
ncbi:MAG: Type secretion system pilin [Candidatus Parcubacteria bacterium]